MIGFIEALSCFYADYPLLFSYLFSACFSHIFPDRHEIYIFTKVFLGSKIASAYRKQAVVTHPCMPEKFSLKALQYKPIKSLTQAIS